MRSAAVRESAGIRIIENAEPLWTDAQAWHVAGEPALISEASDSAVENSPLDPASVFRNAANEIVVADGLTSGWHRLLVYDSLGTFLRPISRRGQGPCEFGQLWWAAPYRGDSIAAFDQRNDAVVILGGDGGCARTVRVPQGQVTSEQIRMGLYSPEAHGTFPDGSILASPTGFLETASSPGTAWFNHWLVRLNPEGAVVDTLGRFRIGERAWDGTRARPIGYGRWAHRALDQYDLIYGDGAGFEYARCDSVGSLKQLVRRPSTQQAVTRDDQIALVTTLFEASQRGAPPPGQRTGLEDRIAQLDWARYKPAYSGIQIDARGNVWVEEYRYFSSEAGPIDPSPTMWSVFTHDGEWLGRVAVPGRLLVRAVYDDLVFGIFRDADGVGSVRGYRLIKPNG